MKHMCAFQKVSNHPPLVYMSRDYSPITDKVPVEDVILVEDVNNIGIPEEASVVNVEVVLVVRLFVEVVLVLRGP